MGHSRRLSAERQNSLSVSPGNPTMISVPMHMCGTRSSAMRMDLSNSPAEYLRFIALRIVSLPLCSGICRCRQSFVCPAIFRINDSGTVVGSMDNIHERMIFTTIRSHVDACNDNLLVAGGCQAAGFP